MYTHDSSFGDSLMDVVPNLPSEQSSGEDLEDTLTPMIRVVLRRGIGHPVLVQWVNGKVGNGPRDPSQARPLARDLSALMRAHLASRNACETVVAA